MWSRGLLNRLTLWLFLFLTTSLCTSKVTVHVRISKTLIASRRFFRKRRGLSRWSVEDRRLESTQFGGRFRGGSCFRCWILIGAVNLGNEVALAFGIVDALVSMSVELANSTRSRNALLSRCSTHYCPAHKLYVITLPHCMCRSLYVAKNYVCLATHFHCFEDVDVENGTVSGEQAVQSTSHIFLRDLIV